MRLATTQFESFGARRAFSCFDEPALKATYDIVITNDPKYTSVLSNSPVRSTTTVANNSVQTTFQQTPKMSTYLVAFVVSDYVYTEAVTDCLGTPIITRVHAPLHLLNQTEVSVQLAATQIAYFCEWYDIPYPLTKEDHIYIPQFAAGAMENWV
jgi:aminopeptidase N